MDDFNEADMFGKGAISGNPLATYFRAPGVHVELPTRGMFFPRASYDATMAGELPVFPMRAADEMLLKSPDALMSGYAIEKLIESCVPGIKDPRRVSNPDLDVILLSIRAATYGDDMDLDVPCPSCNEENSFSCHLPALMSTIHFIQPEDTVVRLTPEVIAYVRPYDLETATRVAMKSYEEARRLQALDDTVQGEERQRFFNASYERMTKLSLNALNDSVVKVVTPRGETFDRQHICEFMDNISKQWVGKIEAAVKHLNSIGLDKSIPVKCVHCEHEWTAEVEFDPSTFFGEGS